MGNHWGCLEVDPLKRNVRKGEIHIVRHLGKEVLLSGFGKIEQDHSRTTRRG